LVDTVKAVTDASKWTGAQLFASPLCGRTVRGVTLRLGDLLAEADLSLRLADGDAAALNQPVRWCAVTELADPRPLLSGGELVLTTGLSQLDEPSQRQFVSRAAQGRAVGLGFGTGLTHDRIPSATLAEARERRLPVLEIPVQGDQYLRKRLVSSPPMTGATTAVLEDCLIAVLEPGQSAREAALLLQVYLTRLGADVRVGIGGWYLVARSAGGHDRPALELLRGARGDDRRAPHQRARADEHVGAAVHRRSTSVAGRSRWSRSTRRRPA
jgi:hypothetical protein